jgi:hypothetical protein
MSLECSVHDRHCFGISATEGSGASRFLIANRFLNYVSKVGLLFFYACTSVLNAAYYLVTLLSHYTFRP